MTVLVLNCCILADITAERSSVSGLNSSTVISDAFRKQDLSPELYSELKDLDPTFSDWTEILTVTMLNGHFHPTELSYCTKPFLKYKKKEYQCLCKYYEAIWKDLEFFPVAGSDICFTDSWMSSWDCMGTSRHEGTDLSGVHSDCGFYPIISMTDGILVQKDWQPASGYTVTIRAKSGGYFYYAHLDSYEKEFSLHDPVQAGDILGYMGCTGYDGKTKPSVQLHLGIYLSVSSDTDLWKNHERENHLDTSQYLSINPFPILLCLRKNIRNYSYS